MRWTKKMERKRLREERAVDRSITLYEWTLPRLSEIHRMTRHEWHTHQAAISGAMEVRKQQQAEGGRWRLMSDGPPRFEPGEYAQWLKEQEARNEPVGHPREDW